jgi:hypothetical protein
MKKDCATVEGVKIISRIHPGAIEILSTNLVICCIWNSDDMMMVIKKKKRGKMSKLTEHRNSRLKIVGLSKIRHFVGDDVDEGEREEPNDLIPSQLIISTSSGI